MIAEVAYMVAQPLSPAEKERLIAMLLKDQQQIVAKLPKKSLVSSSVYTKAECKIMLFNHLQLHKRRKRLVPSANATTSEQPEIMTRIISGDADNVQSPTF